jgi:hypothetical protein
MLTTWWWRQIGDVSSHYALPDALLAIADPFFWGERKKERKKEFTLHST